MQVFEPGEVRQLRLFTWVLLLINLCILGVGLLFGKALQDPRDGLTLVGWVAALVNGAFLLIVGGNVVVVALQRIVGRRASKR